MRVLKAWLWKERSPLRRQAGHSDGVLQRCRCKAERPGVLGEVSRWLKLDLNFLHELLLLEQPTALCLAERGIRGRHLPLLLRISRMIW